MSSKTNKVTKGINFVPDFIIEEKVKIKRLVVISISTALLTILAFCVYYIPDIRISTLEFQNEDADSNIAFFKDVQALYDKKLETEAKLQKKQKIVKEVSKDEVDIVGLLEKLKLAAPQNVQLSYLSVGEKKDISISYIVNTPIEANMLVDNLRNTGIFESVDMPSIPITEKTMDVSFKLKLKKAI